MGRVVLRDGKLLKSPKVVLRPDLKNVASTSGNQSSHRSVLPIARAASISTSHQKPHCSIPSVAPAAGLHTLDARETPRNAGSTDSPRLASSSSKNQKPHRSVLTIAPVSISATVSSGAVSSPSEPGPSGVLFKRTGGKACVLSTEELKVALKSAEERARARHHAVSSQHMDEESSSSPDSSSEEDDTDDEEFQPPKKKQRIKKKTVVMREVSTKAVQHGDSSDEESDDDETPDEGAQRSTDFSNGMIYDKTKEKPLDAATVAHRVSNQRTKERTKADKENAKKLTLKEKTALYMESLKKKQDERGVKKRGSGSGPPRGSHTSTAVNEALEVYDELQKLRQETGIVSGTGYRAAAKLTGVSKSTQFDKKHGENFYFMLFSAFYASIH